jgi:ribosomal protein S12 methylthiotransferase
MEIQRAISLEQNEQRIGKTTRAVIERIEDGNFVGRTEWDAPEIDNEIFIPKKSGVKIGDFVTVKIDDATEYDLYGEIITRG